MIACQWIDSCLSRKERSLLQALEAEEVAEALAAEDSEEAVEVTEAVAAEIAAAEAEGLAEEEAPEVEEVSTEVSEEEDLRNDKVYYHTLANIYLAFTTSIGT